MQPWALAPYDDSLTKDRPLSLQHGDGRVVELDVRRWLAGADEADLAVVRRCASPVLDAGCGPGRIVEALIEHGVFGIGVDVSATAVALASARGVTALHRDLFERLPGEGRWNTVLLLDGNVGIGGDLPRLLHRVHALLAPGAPLIVETHPDPAIDERHTVRFVTDDVAIGPEFPWCYAGLHAVLGAASRCGLTVADVWEIDGRTFAQLGST